MMKLIILIFALKDWKGIQETIALVTDELKGEQLIIV